MTAESTNAAWLARATRVIPGGIYGHVAPALLGPGSFPAYAAEGQGCRYRDVEGREYIDFMCAYGPLLLGYHHPEVEAAAEAARRRGACFNHPTTLMVELAETLVGAVDFADWAVFAKNGSDLMSWAIMVARAATGRPKILKVHGAYHGTHAWCTPGQHGLIPEDRAQVHDFAWNDVAALEASFKTHRGRIAALVLTPFHHPAYGDSALPTPEFVTAVNRLCRAHGALLVLDDVRAAFRLGRVGSHPVYGYEPDIAVYCKALANGHPLSAAVGRAALQADASRVFLTGSFWQDPAPLAAALAVLKIAAREDIPARLARAGQRFLDGLTALGTTHGLPILTSGPPAMPFARVADDPSLVRTQGLYAAAARHGVFLHPHHNWFLGTAHHDADIDEALTRLDAAFQDYRQRAD